MCDIGGAGDGRACELCDRPSTSGAARAAAWYCRRCRLAYCRPCLRLFHPRRGSLASHRILPASEAPAAARGDEQRCRAHPLEVATVYCEACAVCACHVCVCDGGAHVGHAIVTLKAACAKMKVVNLVITSVFRCVVASENSFGKYSLSNCIIYLQTSGEGLIASFSFLTV